jgi:hypothetical protein
MRNYKNKGYDSSPVYSEAELERMYVKEGKTSEEAKKMARKVHLAMDYMKTKERRLWDKVRDNEIRVGYYIDSTADEVQDMMKRIERGEPQASEEFDDE